MAVYNPLTNSATLFALYTSNKQIMKKHLLWFMVAVVVVLLAAWCKPIIANINFQQPVSKSVSFAVFKANNYTSKVYDDASVKLSVVIVKVSGSKRSTVWQKSYGAKLLNQYPSVANAMSQTVVVDNINDRSEHLEVIYTLTYNAKGSTVTLQDGTVIARGEKTGRLAINI